MLKRDMREGPRKKWRAGVIIDWVDTFKMESKQLTVGFATVDCLK